MQRTRQCWKSAMLMAILSFAGVLPWTGCSVDPAASFEEETISADTIAMGTSGGSSLAVTATSPNTLKVQTENRALVIATQTITLSNTVAISAVTFVPSQTFTGFSDIVALDSSGSQIIRLVNDGKNGFTQQAPAATGTNPSAMTTADTRGIGRTDVVVVTNSCHGNPSCSIPSQLCVNLRNMDGSYANGACTTLMATDADAVKPLSMPTGPPDLIAVSAKDNMDCQAHNNGSGTYSTSCTTISNVCQGPTDVAIGDVNGDHIPDKVEACSLTNNVCVSLGGSSGFGSPSCAASGGGTDGVALGDLNHDAKPDIVATNSQANSACIFPNLGAGNFGACIPLATGPTPCCPQITDLNKDGNLDVLINDADPNFRGIEAHVGRGSFLLNHAVHFTSFMQPGGLAEGDMNNDGIPDLLFADNANNRLAVLEISLNGNVQIVFAKPFASLTPIVALTRADLNGDGKLDAVAVSKSTNSVLFLPGNGDLTLGAPVQTMVGSAPVAIAVADFNGDGKLDLAVANSGSNTVTILFGKGDGTFPSSTSLATGTNPSSVTATDFNLDGITDIAVANQGDGTVSVFINNGNGTFKMPTTATVGSNPTAVVSADFNGDGKPDLATSNSFDGTVSVRLGNGDGTFGPQKVILLASTAFATSLVATDVNGDGKADIVVADQFFNRLYLVLGKGNGTFWPISVLGTDSGPMAIVTGDFSGRGGQDLFVATAAGIELLENDPIIAVGTQKLSFGKQTVNTTGPSKAIGVFNPSGAPLAITSIVASGPFSQTNNCPPVLDTLKKCTLNAAFTPTALGPLTGSITINSNSLAGKPVVIKLTGTGD